ncbi:MAG: L-lactate dehydrogenase [Elusimicrobia bacterium]|nr:L-lactate dehydrogenase [Elusimicrobiota bacterium]
MKVGVIGAGFVGSTGAYAMVLQGAASEIVLIDINRKLAQAQAEDILHATPFGPSARIDVGDYPDLVGTQVVVLACGVAQKPGETRIQLLDRNVKVFQNVIPQVLKYAPEALLVVVSNPVDVLTHIVTRLANRPPGRVMGSGTILDTARFRALVGDTLGVTSHSVQAYVVGEHGDSEVLCWSSAQVGGLPIEDFAAQIQKPLTTDVKAKIDGDVRQAAARIIEGKQASYYGIGAGIARLVRALRDDERAVFTVSNGDVQLSGLPPVCLSLPRVVGSQGIISTLKPTLSFSENQALLKSAHFLESVILELGFK